MSDLFASCISAHAVGL